MVVVIWRGEGLTVLLVPVPDRLTEVATDFVGEQQLHDRIQVRATTKSGEVVEITGKVLSMIPLRNRRDGRVTRIAEGMTEWRWGDGVGYGLSEYLDHLAE